MAAIAGTAALVFGSVTTFLLMNAQEQRKQLALHALERTASISDMLDREIGAHLFLLRGLSTSPALKTADLKTFYDQLIATPGPAGSWLALWDDQRQIANTRLAYGESYPLEWTGSPRRRLVLGQLREHGYWISNRIFLFGTTGNGASIGVRVDGVVGQREYFLTTIMDETRLRSLLQSSRAPTDWLIAVFDRNLDKIASTSPTEKTESGEPPQRLSHALAAGDSGQFIGESSTIGRLLVSYAKSQFSGWTVAVKVPLDVVDASWNNALHNSAVLGGVLLLLSMAVGWVVAREVVTPLQEMNSTVSETEGRLRATAADLLRAEARYETFWRHMPESLFAVRVTEDQRFIFDGINPVHEHQTGLRQADLAGKEPHECLPPEIAAAVAANYRACVQAGKPISYDEILELPGGRRRWHTSLAPVKDPRTGKTFFIVGGARDVTHDRDARDSAERARRLLQRIMDASPDVIYVYNVIGQRFAFISGRIDEVVGYQPDYFRRIDGSRLQRFLHPDDVAGVNRHLASLEHLADGAVTSHEFRIIGGDGKYRWLRSKDVVFSRTADGRVARVVGVARNIDHVKQAQAELRAMNARLSTILASISDCYLTIDCDFRITDINPVALDWLGLRRQEAIAQPYPRLRLSSPEHDAAIRALLQKQQAASLEIRSAFSHGRWLDLHFYPTPEGATLFFRDVTKRKLAEQEAARTKELLQASLDALSAHVAILDGYGTIIAVNKAWENWTKEHGFREACVGKGYLNFCDTRFKSSHDAHRISKELRSILCGDQDDFRLVCRVTLADRQVWFQMSAARFNLEGVTKIVVSNEDITDVMEARHALDELSERLLALQEEERQRIAQELHDSTAQHLVAASLNIMSLKAKTASNGSDRKLVDDIESSLEEATKELRVSTFLLHPPHLASDGLKASLQSYVKGFGRRTGLRTAIRVPCTVNDLPISLQRTLLRVIQEALANVHRHAAATEVSINVHMSDDEIRLLVRDNGHGISELASSSDVGEMHYGLGIPGMRARLHRFGGDLDIDTGPDGTTVLARLPLGREEGEAAQAAG